MTSTLYSDDLEVSSSSGLSAKESRIVYQLNRVEPFPLNDLSDGVVGVIATLEQY